MTVGLALAGFLPNASSSFNFDLSVQIRHSGGFRIIPSLVYLSHSKHLSKMKTENVSPGLPSHSKIFDPDHHDEIDNDRSDQESVDPCKNNWSPPPSRSDFETPAGETHEFLTLCCDHCGKQIEVPVYCGNRFCPICSLRRLNRVKRRLQFLATNCKIPPGYKCKFLTLTIKNQKDVHTMVRDLVRSFRKLRQRALWKSAVTGGAYVLEIKGGNGGWHVHIHAIIISKWIKWEDLLKAWKAVSTGTGVWIEDVPVQQTVNYLSKYLTKPAVSDDDLSDANWALKGTRLFSPFGDWHTLAKLFEMPKATCKECNGGSWSPFSLIYTGHIETHFTEVSQVSARSSPV